MGTMTGGRTWARGDQWFIPPGWAGRDSNMWDLADYDELSNGPWDEAVLADARVHITSSTLR